MMKLSQRTRRMRSRMLLATLAFSASSYAVAQTNHDATSSEKSVEGKIISVALFKNGLAVIKREVALKGAGVYRLDDVPEPVHGTFFVESNGSIEARVENRKAPSKNSPPLGTHLQDELAGLKVTIVGRSSKAPIAGTVLSIPKPELEPIRPTIPAGMGWTAPLTPPTPSRFLMLKTEKGIRMSI